MKRYVLVGAGSRGYHMYARALKYRYADAGELVGVCDINPGRAALVAAECGGRVYVDFTAMLHSERPEVAIITTVDATHHKYILDALYAGCDVISEKPMTVSAEACRDILRAERETGHSVRVGFNLRYAPFPLAIRQALQQGAVGDIYSVHFEWLLDTSHGADYFRRWHRYMRNSGGLLIHKASHHFDMANWLIGQDPVNVHAFGHRRFYGDQPQSETGGHREHGGRCLGCEQAGQCPYYWDIEADEFCREHYLRQEHHDGYIRDSCVFTKDIDIYDTVSAVVQYDRGATMSYSLTAHSPYEGWRIAINGEKGRLEASDFSSGWDKDIPTAYHVFDRAGHKTSVLVPRASGGHGGADEQIQRDLFIGGGDDPWHQRADSRVGALALLIGVAANQSIAEGRCINIADLLGEEK